MRAEIISQAGNDVAFPRCESLQAGSSHLPGGFLVLLSELLLPSHDVEFRLSRARTEGANTNSVWLHFLRQAFGKKKVEGFRCRVGRNVRNSLEGSSGGEDQNVTAAATHHVGKIKTCEVNNGRAIDLHHIEQPLGVDLSDLAVLAEAGVVDEELNGQALLPGERVDFLRGVALR